MASRWTKYIKIQFLNAYYKNRFEKGKKNRSAFFFKVLITFDIWLDIWLVSRLFKGMISECKQKRNDVDAQMFFKLDHQSLTFQTIFLFFLKSCPTFFLPKIFLSHGQNKNMPFFIGKYPQKNFFPWAKYKYAHFLLPTFSCPKYFFPVGKIKICQFFIVNMPKRIFSRGQNINIPTFFVQVWAYCNMPKVGKKN